MADLISSLADSIIALINSKPASPTKEEVHETIQSIVMLWDPINHVVRSPLDADINVHRPIERAFGDCQGEAQVTIVSCGHDFVDNRIIGMRQCAKCLMTVAYSDDDYRNAAAENTKALLQSSAQFAERMERRAVEVFNDLPAGNVCCPRSMDGKHAYSYFINADDYRCPCGSRVDAFAIKARKP